MEKDNKAEKWMRKKRNYIWKNSKRGLSVLVTLHEVAGYGI